jgi:cell wall-associated NlpC family hydrolase
VVQVRSFFANIYREKSVTMHEPVLTVPFETRLEVAAKPTAEDERWYQVKLVSGGTAFVQAGDVAPLSGALSIPEAIQLAKRFLGFSYLWGGSSAYGYDCSGFMQMLMRQRGLIMPRDADLQAAWTGLASVDKEKVQAGDLLYFGSAADKITHTGMYIGERQFIHSTTHARPVIQIGNLDEEPWSKLLVAIRRPKS